jgi:hypothetical protein
MDIDRWLTITTLLVALLLAWYGADILRVKKSLEDRRRHLSEARRKALDEGVALLMANPTLVVEVKVDQVNCKVSIQGHSLMLSAMAAYELYLFTSAGQIIRHASVRLNPLQSITAILLFAGMVGMVRKIYRVLMDLRITNLALDIFEAKREF